MKQIITAAIVFLLFTISATAQKRKCGNEMEKHHQKGKKEFAQKLNLNTDQQVKAKQINEKYKADRKALQSNDKMTLGEFKAKKEALDEQRKNNVKAILTPEQVKQMEAQKQNGKGSHRGKHGDRSKALQSKLNLNESQMATLKANKEKSKAAREAIKNDKNLTEEQKKTKISELKKSNEMEFMKGLNAEQKQKLEELKKNRKDKTPKV